MHAPAIFSDPDAHASEVVDDIQVKKKKHKLHCDVPIINLNPQGAKLYDQGQESITRAMRCRNASTRASNPQLEV